MDRMTGRIAGQIPGRKAGQANRQVTDVASGQAFGRILKFPDNRRGQQPHQKCARLISSCAIARHNSEDVFWLKENAELLNILECTSKGLGLSADLGEEALAPLAAFYADAERRLCFFRQYYRFILSICMDLEDLGLGGGAANGRAEALAHWVNAQGLPGHELSDLQRAEARRLLARRGVDADTGHAFSGLTARLHDFINDADKFAIPNKKAAYELTHIVFYLSDYGRHDPKVSSGALRSLINVGVLAFLDQDADLLAEVCIAQRYAGQLPPRAWEHWLQVHTRGFAVLQDTVSHQDSSGSPDDYHMFFVGNWHLALCCGEVFPQPVPTGGLRFRRPAQRGILQNLSRIAFSFAGQTTDWHIVRTQLFAELTEEEGQLLSRAENSCPDFGSFFEGFARAGTAGMA